MFPTSSTLSLHSSSHALNTAVTETMDDYKIVQILPCLYLSDVKPAQDSDYLKKKSITHIVNLTGPDLDNPLKERYPNAFPQQFTYYRLCLADELSTGLLPYFDKIFDFIHHARKTNHTVLVHCEAGISRSSTAIISYLMKECEISLKEAYELVFQKKHNIGPNKSFFEQLISYEKELKKVETPSLSLEDYLVHQLITGPASNFSSDQIKIALRKHQNDTNEAINELWDNFA